MTMEKEGKNRTVNVVWLEMPSNETAGTVEADYSFMENPERIKCFL